MFLPTLSFLACLASGDALASAGPRTVLVEPIASAQSDIGAAVAVAGALTLVSGCTRNAKGEDDALLLALDAVGHVAWRSTLPGGGDAALWSVRALDDGGSIAAGWTKSARGDRDALLARFDSTGGVLWTRSYGSERDERLWSLEVTQGGFVAAGESVAGERTGGLFLSTDREGRELALRTPGEAESSACSRCNRRGRRYVLAGMAGKGPRESQDTTRGSRATTRRASFCGTDRWRRLPMSRTTQRARDGGLVVLAMMKLTPRTRSCSRSPRASCAGSIPTAEWRRSRRPPRVARERRLRVRRLHARGRARFRPRRALDERDG
jgi:hypothetical protein